MNEEFSSHTSGRLMWIIMTLVIAGSGAAIIRANLVSPRPDQTIESRLNVTGLTHFNARLWEDPIGSADAHYRKNEEQVDQLTKERFRRQLAQHNRRLQNVLKRSEDSQVPNTPGIVLPHQLVGQGMVNSLKVIPVLVSGDGYGEVVEDRIRSRYAVIAGLGAAGYNAFDGGHLTYMNWAPNFWIDAEYTRLLSEMADVELGVEKAKHERLLADVKEKALVYSLLKDKKTRLQYRTALKDAQSKEKAQALLAAAEERAGFQNLLSDAAQRLFEKSSEHNALIVYELFYNSKTKNYAMVIWIDENFLAHPIDSGNGSPQAMPLQLLGNIVDDFLLDLAPQNLSKKDMHVIGPMGSGTLQAMVDEIGEGNIYSSFAKSALNEVTMYSPWSTVDDEILLKYRGDSESLPGLFEDVGIAFDRIGSDKELLKAIKAELQLRNKAFCGPDMTSHVVLIHENNTLYGRSVRESIKKNKIFPEGHAHYVTYLRGLDGKTLSNGLGSSSSSESERSDSQGLGRPLGTSQGDYLRRLEKDLVDLRKKHYFKAIGVVGSDEFDKVLILRALRRKFRDCLFFTTDLDTVFETEEEFRYVRNTIVASFFGLRLRDTYQGDVLSFRSGYQTAVYYGTLRAMGYTAPNGRDIGSALRGSPRIFEIGYSGAFDLSKNVCDDYCPDKNVCDKNCSEEEFCNEKCGEMRARTLHPDSDVRIPALLLKKYAAAFIFLPFCIILIVIAGSDVMKEQLVRIAKGRRDGTDKAGADESLYTVASDFWSEVLYRKVYLTAITLCSGTSIISFLFLSAMMNAERWDDEPFVIFEGISTWPTTFLRVVVMLLGLYYMARIQWIDSYASKARIVDSYGFDIRSSISKYISKRGLALEQLYGAYVQKGGFRYRVWRIVGLTILYLMIYEASKYYSEYFTPHRGNLTGYIEGMFRIGVTLTTLVLVMYVVDATMQCHNFIVSIRERTDLHDEFIAKYRITKQEPRWLRTRNSSAQYRELEKEHMDCVRVVALETETVGKYIYYAFIIIILTIIARSWYFDFYNWPMGMVAVIGLLIATNVAALLILQQSARNFRNRIRWHIAMLISHPELLDDDKMQQHFSDTQKQLNEIQIGAFRPLSQNPVIRAILIPISGFGGLAGFDFILKFLSG